MPSTYQINIDQNTYYPSGNITIFPSSNAVDSGKIWTESNGRHITINITDLNYVISPNPGGYDLSYNSSAEDNSKISIQPGKAIINGFEVNTDVVVSYRLPTSEEIVTQGDYLGHALLCLHTLFDAQENISGNVQVGSVWYCEGIRVEYVSYEDYTNKSNEYLLLGGVKEDGTIKPNDDKFTRIDAKYILVKIEGDPETGAPPTQSTDLLTFINNFLKGYWVSKAGDNEYGELLFKSMPDGYLEEDFDYKTEDPLNSSKFGVKITKTGSTIIVKPETDADINQVTQFLPGIIGFYKGLFKGDENTTFDESIIASGDKLSTDTYNTSNLLELTVDNGVIRLKQSTNTAGPMLSVEANKTTHNGVETGNVIYAVGQNSNTADNDVSTIYTGTINYLVDNQGRIKTVNASNTNQQISIDTINNVITITEPTVQGNNRPALKLQSENNIGSVEIDSTNIGKGTNNSAWNNIVDIYDNLHVKSKTTDNLGSIQADGFIVAGNNFNPAEIEVPDFANSGGNRELKAGDIYGTQVWSAVYNDLAEIFEIHSEDKDKIKPGMILAVDEKDPDYFVLADKYNKCIVGVVSENPAYCCGSAKKLGVPVALAGRVKVKFEKFGFTPKIGNWAELHPLIPGYCTATVSKRKSAENITVGRIIKVIDDETVEVLVNLS